MSPLAAAAQAGDVDVDGFWLRLAAQRGVIVLKSGEGRLRP